MSFGYGFSFPNWQSLSAGGTPTPPANFAVLPAAGTPTYTVTRNILDSTGAVFVVPATVLDSAGTSYTPI